MQRSAARSARSPLLLMALTVFIDITGFGVILPLLPFWAEKLGANPFEVGLILTMYAAAQFLFTPLLGALSDRYGRRPVIIGSLLIEAGSFALTALAGTLPLLLLARFIGGIGASNIGSAQAVVADVTPPEGRARGMGLVGAAIGMGFVVGPAIGGVLAAGGAELPFWVAMGIALVNALLVLWLLPETHARDAKPGAKPGAKPDAKPGAKPETATEKRAGIAALVSGWRDVLHAPAITRLILINLLFTLGGTAMEAVFPLFTQREFHWGATENGYVFTYVGVIIVLMQGGLVGQLVRRVGEQRLMVAGLALLAIGLLLLPFSTGLALLLVALASLSIGEGAVTPTSTALLSLATQAETQGRALGLAQSAAGLGRILGPLAAGGLFAIGMVLPFLAGGTLVAVAALVALPRLPRGGSGHTSIQPPVPEAELTGSAAAR